MTYNHFLPELIFTDTFNTHIHYNKHHRISKLLVVSLEITRLGVLNILLLLQRIFCISHSCAIVVFLMKETMNHMTHWFDIVLVLQIIIVHVLHGNKLYTTNQASYYWVAGPMGRRRVSAGHSHHRKTRIGLDICENWVANFRRFGECKMPMQRHTNSRMLIKIWKC